MIDLNEVSENEAWDKLQTIIDEVFNDYRIHIEEMAAKLGISLACAHNIFYLRERSRWTQDLEDELIRLHKEGNPPNIFEFL